MNWLRRASLLAAAVLVGIVLAVFGQVYQTGADPYGLFLAWALLVLPWTLVGRQAGLWLLWLVLLNLSAILFWTQVLYPPPGWWTLSQLLGPLVMLGAAVATAQCARSAPAGAGRWLTLRYRTPIAAAGSSPSR